MLTYSTCQTWVISVPAKSFNREDGNTQDTAFHFQNSHSCFRFDMDCMVVVFFFCRTITEDVPDKSFDLNDEKICHSSPSVTHVNHVLKKKKYILWKVNIWKS